MGVAFCNYHPQPVAMRLEESLMKIYTISYVIEDGLLTLKLNDTAEDWIKKQMSEGGFEPGTEVESEKFLRENLNITKVSWDEAIEGLLKSMEGDEENKKLLGIFLENHGEEFTYVGEVLTWSHEYDHQIDVVVPDHFEWTFEKEGDEGHKLNLVADKIIEKEKEESMAYLNVWSFYNDGTDMHTNICARNAYEACILLSVHKEVEGNVGSLEENMVYWMEVLSGCSCLDKWKESWAEIVKSKIEMYVKLLGIGGILQYDQDSGRDCCWSRRG